eukprot:CAMPEP_0177693438 /NCGR_PEP_ID=MMETSP0484_2-20121128/2399_1 /TAXON_ID=354590 /ORGANISM="Rhodomonas lens, Strain RHODO" /LENGTH=238 /DNA_ID=CAMNT_0019204247 /DNA_START=1 /DNA_END=717 /DNA_ORIENTATION=+
MSCAGAMRRILPGSSNLSQLKAVAKRRVHGHSLPMRWWTAYQEKLQAGGVVGITAKCLTSALIGAAGDLGCQVLIEGRSMSGGSSSDEAKSKEEPPKFDVDRFAKFTFLGGVLVAPTLHVWYGFLGRTIAGKTLTATVQRVSVDQFLFAPCFIATFFTSLAFLEGKTMKELETQLREEWPSAVVNNWKLWIPAQCINLGVVPPHLQVLFSNFVAVFWNVYLSLVTHKGHAAPSETKTE